MKNFTWHTVYSKMHQKLSRIGNMIAFILPLHERHFPAALLFLKTFYITMPIDEGAVCFFNFPLHRGGEFPENGRTGENHDQLMHTKGEWYRHTCLSGHLSRPFRPERPHSRDLALPISSRLECSTAGRGKAGQSDKINNDNAFLIRLLINTNRTQIIWGHIESYYACLRYYVF